MTKDQFYKAIEPFSRAERFTVQDQMEACGMLLEALDSGVITPDEAREVECAPIFLMSPSPVDAWEAEQERKRGEDVMGIC